MNGQSGPVYNRFVCPHCEVDLNPGNGPIIKMRGRLDSPRFTVHTEVFLPSGLGVYGRLTATAVELREGAKIQFSCPSCGEPFSRSEADDLAHVRMFASEGHSFLVKFNKNYGKRSTFVIDAQGGNLEREFGEDAEDYRHSIDVDKDLNFFGS